MDPQPVERRTTRVGEPFTIRLKVNPTTGFGWQAIYDPNAVALVSQNFEPGSANVGGGGEEVLTFKPLTPGPAAITIELRRPWEKGARESRSYQIDVQP